MGKRNGERQNKRCIIKIIIVGCYSLLSYFEIYVSTTKLSKILFLEEANFKKGSLIIQSAGWSVSQSIAPLFKLPKRSLFFLVQLTKAVSHLITDSKGNLSDLWPTNFPYLLEEEHKANFLKYIND